LPVQRSSPTQQSKARPCPGQDNVPIGQQATPATLPDSQHRGSSAIVHCAVGLWQQVPLQATTPAGQQVWKIAGTPPRSNSLVTHCSPTGQQFASHGMPDSQQRPAVSQAAPLLWQQVVPHAFPLAQQRPRG
jgi:hypothetical protein